MQIQTKLKLVKCDRHKATRKDTGESFDFFVNKFQDNDGHLFYFKLARNLAEDERLTNRMQDFVDKELGLTINLMPKDIFYCQGQIADVQFGE